MHHKAYVLASIGAVLLLAVSCGKTVAVEQVIPTVRAGVVETIHQEAPERYSATIAPLVQVDLAFKSAGIVDRIRPVRGADGRMRSVQAGDYVAKGVELARVRVTDYQQRADQAAAQLAQAEAQVTQARAGFNEAQIEYNRANSLFQSASLVKSQFDQAKGRYDSAAATVKGAEAGVENARAAQSEAKLAVSDTAIRAPFGGWVSARNVEIGGLVGSATPAVSMLDIHLVKAVFAVPDSSLRLVRLGQKQTVMLDVLQHALPGVVTSISPQADPKTRVFAVEVTIANPHAEVKPGMIGSLSLGATHQSNASLTVPLSAVVRSPGNPNGFAVFRLRDGDGKTYAEAQVIQIGQTIGNSIEVTNGLSAGDRIVSLGGSLLRDGQQVSVLP